MVTISEHGAEILFYGKGDSAIKSNNLFIYTAPPVYMTTELHKLKISSLLLPPTPEFRT